MNIFQKLSISTLLFFIFTNQVSAKQTLIPFNNEKAIVLKGQLVPNLEGYATIHPSQIGRIVIDSLYPMPRLGEKVEKGQVIAVVETFTPKVDDVTKRNELHSLEAEIKKCSQEIKRLEQLKEFAVQKNLEEQKIQLQKALKQREEILKLFGREFLYAPIDGAVNILKITSGQVVKPEDTLAEIIKPGEVYVLVYILDRRTVKNFKEITMVIPELGDKQYPLTFIGASPKIEENKGQALLFSPSIPCPELMIGMQATITFPENKNG